MKAQVKGQVRRLYSPHCLKPSHFQEKLVFVSAWAGYSELVCSFEKSADRRFFMLQGCPFCNILTGSSC